MKEISAVNNNLSQVKGIYEWGNTSFIIDRISEKHDHGNTLPFKFFFCRCAYMIHLSMRVSILEIENCVHWIRQHIGWLSCNVLQKVPCLKVSKQNKYITFIFNNYIFYYRGLLFVLFSSCQSWLNWWMGSRSFWRKIFTMTLKFDKRRPRRVILIVERYIKPNLIQILLNDLKLIFSIMLLIVFSK